MDTAIYQLVDEATQILSDLSVTDVKTVYFSRRSCNVFTGDKSNYPGIVLIFRVNLKGNIESYYEDSNGRILIAQSGLPGVSYSLKNALPALLKQYSSTRMRRFYPFNPQDIVER